MKKTLLAIAALAAGLFAAAQNDDILLQEDFTNGNVGPVPVGWQGVNHDGLPNDASFSVINNSWQQAALDAAYTDRCIISACAQITQQGQQTNRWLITPRLYVPTNEYELTFKLKDIAGSHYQEIQVMASTTSDAAGSFVMLRDITAQEIGDTYTEFTVSLSQFADDSVYLAFVNRGVAHGIALDDVKVHAVPAHELSVRNLVASPAVLPVDDPSTLNITVLNGGSEPVTDFTVNVQYSGTEEEQEISGVNIAQGQTYTFAFQSTITMSNDTNVYVVVSVRLNDTIDESNLDNNTDSLLVQFYDPSLAIDNKNALLEHFTTAQCVNCPRVDQQLEQVLPQFGNRVVTVEHHVGYYTDELTLNASEDMLGYYNSNTTFAPALMIDRSQDIANLYAASAGPVFSVGDNASIVGQLNASLNTPSFVELAISDLNYNEQTRQLSVTVGGQFRRTLEMANPSLAVFLTEDSVMASYQSGGSSPYRHDHVIRATISGSDVFGDLYAINYTEAGATFSRTYTYTLPTTLRANRCHVVAFMLEVSNDATRNLVHNARESAALMQGTDPTHTGITATEAAVSIKTWPNPAAEVAYVSAESTILGIEVVNALGQKVYANGSVNADMFELNLDGMASGTYFVRVATAKGTATQRLVVR